MADNVMVIGGAGYIGSHVCKALDREGYTPVAFDNLSTGHPHAVQWGPLVGGEAGSQRDLIAALRDHRPVAIIDLASSAYVADSMREPFAYYRNNVVNAYEMLCAIRASGPVPIIYSSTAAVYGETYGSDYGVLEDELPNPASTYAATKLAAERMVRDMYRLFETPSTIFRYGNAAGADPAGEIGEEHMPEPHLIPRALECAVSGKVLGVCGVDYLTGDGTAVRDYVHVSDLAEAHVYALGHMLSRGGSQILNLGTGKGHSVLEVIAAVEAVTGKKVKTKIDDRRPGDIATQVVNSSNASKVLGWAPGRPALEDIVETAYEFSRRKRD